MNEEMDELMADLASALTSGRTRVEQHADFRQVFLGTDAGKRVLYDILGWAHVWGTSVVKGDPYLTHVREGERALAIKILAVLHVQPKARPDKQRSKE